LGHWADVANAVNDRMAAQGLSQRELAERSGVSPATLRKIQHGDEQARNRSTLANISRALGWPEDHLWRVSSDGLAAASLPDDDPASLRRELAELHRRVGAIESRLEMTDASGQQLPLPPLDAGQVVECSCH
jgi:transcriptional regulator with XRE-family HTH domain